MRRAYDRDRNEWPNWTQIRFKRSRFIAEVVPGGKRNTYVAITDWFGKHILVLDSEGALRELAIAILAEQGRSPRTPPTPTRKPRKARR